MIQWSQGLIELAKSWADPHALLKKIKYVYLAVIELGWESMDGLMNITILKLGRAV